VLVVEVVVVEEVVVVVVEVVVVVVEVVVVEEAVVTHSLQPPHLFQLHTVSQPFLLPLAEQ